MVLDLLAQVLDDAVEYGLLEANPARGKRRRLKVPKSSRSFLEPDMVVDLLDVAGEWERSLPAHQREPTGRGFNVWFRAVVRSAGFELEHVAGHVRAGHDAPQLRSAPEQMRGAPVELGVKFIAAVRS